MKTMKNIMKKLMILLALTVLLGACSTTGNVYDDSVPPEKSAKIALPGFRQNIIYNGVPVELKTVPIITVPAGRATFTGTATYGHEINAVIRDASFSCVLEGGKEYWAVTSHIDAEVSGYIVWGVNLYQDERKKENIIGFIPFDPQITSRLPKGSILGIPIY